MENGEDEDLENDGDYVRGAGGEGPIQDKLK